MFHLERLWQELPVYLQAFLRDSSIKKVGRQVGGDLGRINRAYRMICRGALELGSFCSMRKCIPSGQMSLAEIAFRVLGRRLQKEERLSNWNAQCLAVEQISYAAIDAWASIAIYNAVKQKPEIGTKVTNRNCFPRGSSKKIAFGKIIDVDNDDSNFVTVSISRVQVPGYIYEEIADTHNNNQCALSSFGSPPFNLKNAQKRPCNRRRSRSFKSNSDREDQK